MHPYKFYNFFYLLNTRKISILICHVTSCICTTHLTVHAHTKTTQDKLYYAVRLGTSSVFVTYKLEETIYYYTY